MPSLHRSGSAGMRGTERPCAVNSIGGSTGQCGSGLLIRFVRWLAALDGHDDCESVLSEIPGRAAITADQTGSFILARRSFWLRIAALLSLAIAIVGFALLMQGIDDAERKRSELIRALPLKSPLDVPVESTSGCLVSTNTEAISFGRFTR